MSFACQTPNELEIRLISATPKDLIESSDLHTVILRTPTEAVKINNLWKPLVFPEGNQYFFT